MPEDIHWQQYATRHKTFPLSLEMLQATPGLIICIPVLAEPNLISTLESLWSCDRPPVPVEVILLFNTKDTMASDEMDVHQRSWIHSEHWVNLHQDPDLQFRLVYVDRMPDGKGGVGWARKLVMDEAAKRLQQDGILLCLDGDCTVKKNYMKAVCNYFHAHLCCDAISIYFEHQLEILDGEKRKAIIQYELHLRYLVHAMRWAGHPFAYHTVGSAMAVRRRAYLAQGGMNKRQAGEDFYFLQKFIELDTLHEVRDTVVYPSSRISSRVPFGTGKAMQKLIGESGQWMTTAFEIFYHIRELLQNVDTLLNLLEEDTSEALYDRLQQATGLHPGVLLFLRKIDFIRHCKSIRQHTTHPSTFRRRFFRYFNAFMMIRYTHYMRDHFYSDVDVAAAAEKLCRALNINLPPGMEGEGLLQVLREMDKGG